MTLVNLKNRNHRQPKHQSQRHKKIAILILSTTLNIRCKLISNEKIFIQQEANENLILVKYKITSLMHPHAAAIKLCKEQSLSNALGNDLEVIKQYSAKYLPNSIITLETNQFLVDIAFPLHNVEGSLSMLLSAIGGDTYNIKNLYPIKILAIKLPDAFIKNFSGPRYGVDGLRRILNCYDRPLLCGPIKPCIGLKPDAFAQRAEAALLGGADIVKDDELICDPPYNHLIERVKAVSKIVKKAQDITGEKKMYFCFVGSGSPSEIMKKAELAQQNGADGFMVSPAINGFEIIKDLTTQFTLPTIAHNAFIYSAYTKNHGINFSIFGLFQRLSGADIIITPSKYATFDIMSHEEHLENIAALLQEIPNIKQTFPAFCGGQSPKTVPLLQKDTGSNNFIIVAGTSLYDHPDGPTAGAAELRKSFKN